MKQATENRASFLKISTYSKPKNLLILAIVLVAFSALVIISSNWQTKQTIDEIRISGTEYLFQNEILSIIKPFTANKSDSLVILKRIEHAVETHPFIYKAVASFEKNHILNVKITERIPVGLYQNIDGSFKYIDKTGNFIPYRFIAKFSDLIIVTSKAKSTKNDKKIARYAAKILAVLSEQKYEDFNYKISELIYDNSNATYYLLSSAPDYKILLGRSDEIENKLDKLQEFLRSEVNSSLTDADYQLDLRWHNRIIISKLI
jgi:cell division protein FtsQ